MLGNDADAEDVTQEVLLQLVRKLDTFRGESALPTWLHRVTVNAALSYRRKRAVREAHRAHEAVDELTPEDGQPGPGRPWSAEPERQVLDRETQQLIEEAISRL